MTRRTGADLFVWAVWAAMLGVAIVHIILHGRNIPLAEDWLLVAPLTGNEPSLIEWLWAQNNEHRVPLPRLLYLILLRLSGGDFRVGMLFNALTLGALAASFILVARRLRGRTIVPDALFPVALLHLGNWANLVWSWQIQFVLSTALTCVLLLLVLAQRLPLSGRAAAVGGITLVLLPLSGANGLIMALAFVPWFVHVGLQGVRRANTAGRRSGGALLAASGLALALIAAYFTGFEPADWNPPSPGLAATLRTSGLFLALALGPAASVAWDLAMLAVVAACVVSAGVFVVSIRTVEDAERDRAAGLFLFVGGMTVLTLSIGWGRAGLVPTQGMPDRYTLLAVPALLVVPFIWELYTTGPLRRFVQWGLFAAFVVLLPLNVRAGYAWRNWYVSGMEAVERDLDAQVPVAAMAERHREFLLHWDRQMLLTRMMMLREAGRGPFRRLRADPGERNGPADVPPERETRP